MNSKKDLEDRICSKIVSLETKIIYQKDFDDFVEKNNSPYIINKSGYYKLGENIKINFFSNIYDSLNLNEKNPNPFGNPAAFIIATSYVIFDLNGYAIFQSVQDYCVQRFFAIVQLNLLPFNLNTGPITSELRTQQFTAHYCIIKNGVLGLSSHQSLLGNNNTNIIIEKINCEDFEVSGINLNNCKNLFIENSIVGRSLGTINGRLIPLSPIFAGFTFSHKLMTSVIRSTNNSEKKKIALDIQSEIEDYLLPIFTIIYNNKSLTDIFSKLKNFVMENEKYKIIFNKSGKSICNIHGIKITGPNPSIGPFHNHLEEVSNQYSEYITIKNVCIENIIGCVEEELLFTDDGIPIHICAGLKLSYSLLNNNIIKSLINSIYNLTKDDENLNKLIKTNITKDTLDFINNGLNINNNFGLIRGMDIMAHMNKGTLGIRLGSCNNVDIENIKINNIKNLGRKLEEDILEEVKNKFKNINIIYSDTKLFDPLVYIGTYSLGIINSGCKNIITKDCIINSIESPYGCSIAYAINNYCDNIDINKICIFNINSCDCCKDSRKFVIDNISSNINLNNIKII